MQIKNDDVANSEKSKKISPKIIWGSVGCLIIVCILVGLGVAYSINGLPYFGSKTTVVFVPDVPQDTKVNSSDSELTARILSERGRLLGASLASFKVSANGQIVGEVSQDVDIEELIGAIKVVGLLEFVDFGNEVVSAGTQINTDFEQSSAQVTGKQWHTIASNKDIRSVSVTTDQSGKPAINFSLTPNGTKVFSDYTTNHVGDILGIILDKTVLSTPRISGPITNGYGVISGSFTMDQANSLAVDLRSGPLPIPLKVIQVSSQSK